MNRTLMSYMATVIGQTTNRNPIELIKMMRNHSSVEITNIYINMPQHQVNKITNHLFNLGNFGFVYDTMATILTGQKNKDNFHDIDKIKAFGTISKIEKISEMLNAIYEEKNLIYDLLKKTSAKEIKEKYTLANFGLLPSKDIELQCLVSESNCPFPQTDCYNCILAIPNIHSIATIINRFEKKLEEFTNNFNQSQMLGDKTRLANQLFIERELLIQAIKHFGRERIEQFIDGGFDAINKKWESIGSFIDFLTISKEG